MSAEPDVRQRLIEAAADVLGEEGPGALSARRLARDVGTSTMAVYTHFGGMPGLVRAVVAEGFRRLYDRVAAAGLTDDPVVDLAAAAAAYRAHALADPHLYSVMFGSASLGEYRLHDEELEVGLAAFDQLVALVERAMVAGALRQADPAPVAAQLWTALHGYVVLEIADFYRHLDDPESQVLQPMLAHLLASVG
ncbi:TetR/AcrR family transcriptional regulator [Nocardioides sp. YIM 152315]|uniref:TetR/AcrR family transcriptional regulator n=1 Tax=Nocardioides sp. YIM 152315 TaxID=3031760 RepID=UPI0023DC19E5|nr:TetR/AcrR family transcriptional regulator [Nocardioides sp. YIM 152315]MDF1604282.1 TetR/AcrR family transcriptional regulator [Nocardioides sp. YIM 152315]